MQKVRIPVTNFQFGEISPSLISRTDTQIYTNSAQRLENVFIRAEGGVIKHAGLRYIYEFDTSVEDTSSNLFSNQSCLFVIGVSTMCFLAIKIILLVFEFFLE